MVYNRQDAKKKGVLGQNGAIPHDLHRHTRPLEALGY